MSAFRVSFVFAAIVGLLTAFGGSFGAVAWAQDAQPQKSEPRPEPQQKADPAPRAEPKARTQTKRAPAPAPAAERDEDRTVVKRATPPASCGWIGKRVIQSLLRDDAVTAQDFDRLYRTFDCSGEYLRHAFDCTVSDGAPQTANESQLRVDACWEDPSATKIEIPAAATPNKTTPTTSPGSGTSQPKGAAGAKGAPSPEPHSTPNYPKGK